MKLCLSPKVRGLLGVAAAATLLICLPSAHSQEIELAPAAQDSMNRGLAAVQQQHYKSAYRYFLDAQKISPDASQVWFNLGLAASKIPGHEFRAIAWLKAYLLANPNVKNAEAIRGANARLEAALFQRGTDFFRNLPTRSSSSKKFPHQSGEYNSRRAPLARLFLRSEFCASQGVR